MSRFQLLMLTICVVFLTAGCRNRCGNPCGNVYGGNAYGNGVFAGGGSTIAPPPTYSLNIPSLAGNQPYYTPGQTAPTNNTLNPNQRAPVPALRQATQQNQNGWRSVDDNLSNSNNTAPLNQNNGRSVLATPTTFAQSAPATNAGSGTRTASTTALPSSGASFTSSPNYQTTRVDETQDASRLPLNDATQVRAPARNFPTGTPLTTIPNTVVPNNGSFTSQQAAYNAAMQQIAAQTAALQRNPTGYVASPVIIGNQPVATGYQGQPLLFNQPLPTSSAPTVLAQSTATTATGASAGQLGWRDRDLTGQSNRF